MGALYIREKPIYMVQITNPQSNELFRKITREERVQRYLQELERYHSETYEHSLRVGLLSIDLGYDNTIDGENLRNLGYGGLLHDIGKLRIPQEILTKEARLGGEELNIMRGHPKLGYLELKDPEYETVRRIVAAHHEFKLLPYPRKGKDRRKIDHGQEDRRRVDETAVALAQIVAISDIYDALASKRAYKGPLELSEIEGILREQFIGDSKYIDQVLRKHS